MDRRVFRYRRAGVAGALLAAAAAAALTGAAVGRGNGDCAKLLGLNQQAVAWELPSGDATGVTEQAGRLTYTIAGS